MSRAGVGDELPGSDLWQLVVDRSERTPQQPFLIDEQDRVVTFGDFRDRASRVAAGLQTRHGVVAGTRVLWMLPTWIEAVVISAALSRLSAVQIPLLPIYRQRELGFIARQTGAPLLIIPQQWRGTDYEALAHDSLVGMATPPKLVVADPSLPDGDPGGLPNNRPGPTAGDRAQELRWIFFTSGTTADPKGAKHSDATIAACARGMIAPWQLTASDVATLAFPFAHIGGASLLFISLMAGSSLLLAEAFDPPRVVDQLSRHGVTLAGSGPAFWRVYIDAQRAEPHRRLFPKLRALIGGGAAKPATMNGEARAVLGVDAVTGYGLTECPALVLNHIGDSEAVLATDGRCMEGAEMRVVGLDGRVAAPDDEGEIRVRGTMLFLGYLDESLDSEALDDEGWLRTGDLGRMDQAGQLVVTGRLKDIIIRKGENISAKEIEDVLVRHPSIADVAVIGLPDDERGERACAVVALTDSSPALDAASAGRALHRRRTHASEDPRAT